MGVGGSPGADGGRCKPSESDPGTYTVRLGGPSDAKRGRRTGTTASSSATPAAVSGPGARTDSATASGRSSTTERVIESLADTWKTSALAAMNAGNANDATSAVISPSDRHGCSNHRSAVAIRCRSASRLTVRKVPRDSAAGHRGSRPRRSHGDSAAIGPEPGRHPATVPGP